MSCPSGHDRGCPCDRQEYGTVPDIAAGLENIPRQAATFSGLRSALLRRIGQEPRLSGWGARDSRDLGVMLVDMWAYVCDVLGFYDETIAHECYLRTARLRPSLRKLVGLLGYLPRPAVGSRARLAAFAEGRQAVTLPAGTAFRSSAFDGEPPQVFELEADANIHPLMNEWDVRRPARETMADPAVFAFVSQWSFLLKARSARVQEGDAVVLSSADDPEGWAVARTVTDVEPHAGADRERYVRIALNSPIILRSATQLAAMRIETPTRTAFLNLEEAIPKESQGVTAAPTEEPSTTFTLANGPTYLEPARSRRELAVLLREWASRAGVAEGLILQVHPGGETEGSAADVNDAGGLTFRMHPGGAGNGEGDGLGNEINLDSIYRDIRPGMTVLLAHGEEVRWFTVRDVEEAEIPEKMPEGKVLDPDGSLVEGVRISLADMALETRSDDEGYFRFDDQDAEATVRARVTRLTLDADLNDLERSSLGQSKVKRWDESDLKRVTVLYAMVEAGEMAREALSELRRCRQLKVLPPVKEPRDFRRTGWFFLKDGDGRGREVSGSMDFGARRIDLDEEAIFDPSLRFPLSVFGNVVDVTRGETVRGEVLGSGDASIANQTFRLSKKPLTYFPSPTANNDSGVASTLEVYVDGIRWSEVPGFFGVAEDAQVYIVRQDDEGNSHLTFGDGWHGARLPTGRDDVRANYRYGAGAASPPAGSINQIARPVKGLKSVKNVRGAGGGDDAESAGNIRAYAPASALTLGRAVSTLDMEAVVSQVPGVRTVRVQWGWGRRNQMPVVQVWYVGSAETKTVMDRLRGVMADAAFIEVDAAEGLRAELILDLGIDPRYIEDDVEAAVTEALVGRPDGYLLPERTGIGNPLYRSQIVQRILSVEGVVAVRGMRLDGNDFSGFAETPGSGKYFDFESGSVLFGKGGETYE